MRFADIDAVTLDAFGTLVDLVDPVPGLERLLRRHGLERAPAEIAAAFAAEAAHYRRRSFTGRDDETLRSLRKECADVFLCALDAPAALDGFATGYVETLQFQVLPRVRDTLAALRARGLALAVISNWDVGLHAHLEELALSSFFDIVVSSAEAGVEKPDPRIFEVALARLAVRRERVVHVGDGRSDEEGAHAAGVQYVAAPLPEAIAGWT